MAEGADEESFLLESMVRGHQNLDDKLKLVMREIPIQLPRFTMPLSAVTIVISDSH